MTGLRWGVTSDVGRSRQVNQDSVLAEAPLFVVADGMGGHAAGEVASQLALGIARQHVGPGHRPSLDALVDAVAVANRVVFDKARVQAEYRGMGTTFCGLALLDGDANGAAPTLALVNVGDSRAYVVRGDAIQQLTRDHSYVEDLVQAGEITALEARSHPQRHIVTRALGVEPNVLVDTWERPATVGERYIICSDGLSNELEDDDIVRLSRANPDPQNCADRLVALANERGGRDNVTVLVVDVIDDDGFDGRIEVPAPPVGMQVGDLQAMAHPNPATFGAPTTPAWALDDDAAATRPAATTLVDDDPLPPPSAAGAARPAAATEPPPPAPQPSSKGARKAQRQRARKGPTKLRTVIRNVAFLAVFLVVLGFALGSIQAYGRAGWYMTFRNDQVTLYQGRAEGLLWVKPVAKATYPLTRTELTPDWQTKIDKHITFTSREAAERWYGLLAVNPDAVPRLAGSTTTTAPGTTTTTVAGATAGATTTAALPTSSPTTNALPTTPVATTSAAAPVVTDTTVAA